MRQWNIIWRSADIYGTPAAIEVSETPLWAYVVEIIVGWILGSVFRHRLCCNIPEFLWKIPLGRPKYYSDDPDLLANSVADKMYDFVTKSNVFVLTYRHAKNKMEFPLDPKWLKDHREWLVSIGCDETDMS